MSDCNVNKRGFRMVKDLLEQLINKIEKVSCYGLQLDESTDMEKRAQLLVVIRIPGVDLLAVADENCVAWAWV